MYKRAGCTTRLADSLVVGSAGLDDVAWPFVVVVVVIGALGFLDASIRWTDLRIRSRRSPELKIRGPTTYPRLYFERRTLGHNDTERRPTPALERKRYYSQAAAFCTITLSQRNPIQRRRTCMTEARVVKLRITSICCG
ncbi:hypothetical protein D9611_014825 [Ephemerocybe angulata]|uniref:Uncharacterized protein n=1 Tax=Ephemerocybe angulata TaxID=980116 RepID=A0A8H5C9L7_9AGAR|nr:hypothetical protein D9611_014825 [Tulosesus angulatus]